MNLKSAPLGAITVGALIGLMVSPASNLLTNTAYEVYDRISPVVTADVALLAKQPEHIDISLRGQKNRQCAYMDMSAYMHYEGGTFDARIDRIDKPATGVTRPVGRMDMGTWRVQPLKGANRMTVVMQHQCNGRLVLTEIGGVDL